MKVHNEARRTPHGTGPYVGLAVPGQRPAIALPNMNQCNLIGTNHCIEPPDAVFILDINGAIVLEINSCLPPTKSVDDASERRKVMRCETQLRERDFFRSGSKWNTKLRACARGDGQQKTKVANGDRHVNIWPRRPRAAA